MFSTQRLFLYLLQSARGRLGHFTRCHQKNGFEQGLTAAFLTVSGGPEAQAPIVVRREGYRPPSRLPEGAWRGFLVSKIEPLGGSGGLGAIVPPLRMKLSVTNSIYGLELTPLIPPNPPAPRTTEYRRGFFAPSQCVDRLKPGPCGWPATSRAGEDQPAHAYCRAPLVRQLR
jgi:hypothetical protein